MANLRFITGIRFYKQALEQLNHVTFIYDPNWDINNSREPTLPLCFFYVKSMHEIKFAEVSQKQMLFYNSNEKGGQNQADAGLLNVVADNIVTKPKVYKLDLIIPYSDLTLLSQSFVYNVNTFEYVNSLLITNNPALRTWVVLDTYWVKFWKDLIHSIMNIDFGTFSTDKIANIISQPSYNKNSLELMFDLRRILKIKLWNSWTYKYVAITDLDITKEGTEDGVYEASMTVQEMPVLTLQREDSQAKKFTYVNKLLQKQGEGLIKAMDTMGVEITKK